MRSASRSVEPIESVKYAATVAVKSLIEREGEDERERIRRKNRMAIVAFDRSDRNVAASDSRVLKKSEKERRVDNASISDIYR